jgi:hypothetical protein
MEETIHRFGPANHARNECQHEMKCHAGSPRLRALNTAQV